MRKRGETRSQSGLEEDDPEGAGAANHYFSPKPTAASETKEVVVDLRGITLRLKTDHGVFSFGKADRGTRLLAKEMWIPPQGRVLDLGCGWGLLGILAAKLEPEAQVLLVDINERAVALAEENIRRNGVSNATALAGDAREAVSEQFDTIVCNPPINAGKAVVMGLIELAAQHLSPNGELWLVIQTHHGAKTYQRDIAPWFASVTLVSVQGGFRVFVAKAKGGSG